MARTQLHFVGGNPVSLAHTLPKSDFDTTGNTEKVAALSYCRNKTTFVASPIIAAALTHIDLGLVENVSLRLEIMAVLQDIYSGTAQPTLDRIAHIA